MVALTAVALLAPSSASAAASVGEGRHTFTLGTNDFLLDGKPFLIRSGEIHPERIPKEYWRHRVRMAKAMGLNTIAAYVFWAEHEPEEGRFDFKTGNRDLAEFLKIVREEGMWLFLRPGPYCCAEYDFGGMPPYLLRYPDLKIRCMDPRYTAAAERYIRALAKVIKPWQVSKGGPIVMLQVENEYGSYGNDRTYMKWLHDLWRKVGIEVPFSTGDGPTTYMLEAGSLPGCAVGLDSGSEEGHWQLARKMNPGVPVFSSETYPGWLTHWGESWARVETDGIKKEVRWLLEHDKSFNLYMFHGGTSFGFTAGSNADRFGVATNGVPCSFMPDITSYDYDCPVTEQGRATSKYHALRELLGSFPAGSQSLPPVPEPIPAMAIPEIKPELWTTIWAHMPKGVKTAQPKPFEMLGQTRGFMLYRTKLVGHHSGRLLLRELNDYGQVFLDGKYVGAIDRRLAQNSIALPRSENPTPTLEVLVEAMGHINFGEFVLDRKGITERATLNGMTLMDWEVFGFPLEEKWITALSSAKRTGAETGRPGGFFKARFDLPRAADTFLDMSGYQKGYVWVNGHNLGRYWNIGPQQRLFCPASWLRAGANELLVLDLHQTEAKPVSGRETLTD